VTEPGLIQFSEYFTHPPAKVWQALTDPGLHAQWWAAGDIKPIVGHRFSLDMGAWGFQPCEVLEVETERLFRYSFAPGTLDTTITWRLEPEGTGTRLFLEHSGFDLDSPMGKSAFSGMAEGWPKVLARLPGVLDSLLKSPSTLIKNPF
jgi:uncharacterized protein YndB with AHSA1/START domain